MTREKFKFVPALNKYEGIYSDKELCDKWNISYDEWQYIDSKIADIDGGES